MFGQIGELKKMYDKYKELQTKLKNLLIRAKQGSFTNASGETQEGRIIVEMTGELKIKKVSIEDLSLLDVIQKEELESELLACIEKAQTKAQEVAQTKTKEILGFDPSDLAGMMAGGGMPKIPGLS